MASIICTLFEGGYHFGVAALVNSLYAHGFRGLIYVGYRGALPPWAASAKKNDGFTEFSPADGCTIRFVQLTTNVHLTNYKPEFMLTILKEHHAPPVSLFYFDPDIVVSCRWSFFEDWVQAGVALCQNSGAWCPKNHPFRHAWRQFLARENLACRNELDEYFNAGFVGVTARDQNFIETWAEIIRRLGAAGLIQLSKLESGQTVYAFNVGDQDALNITAMSSAVAVSSIGEEAMGFAYGGSGTLMLHATGSPKPWKKQFAKEALRGRSPSRADRGYWNQVQTPIRLYSPFELFLRRADFFAGKIIGRYL